MSVPRRERLQASEFQAIFKQQGRREQCESFTALWQPAEGIGKVGFAVGRRIGGAVQRNRARRRLREAYRHEHELRPPGIDVVFIGRPAVLVRPFREIRSDMQATMDTLRRRVARTAVR